LRSGRASSPGRTEPPVRPDGSSAGRAYGRRCRPIRRRRWRIEEAAAGRLIEKSRGTRSASPAADRRTDGQGADSAADGTGSGWVGIETDGEDLLVSLGGETHRLDREAAARLRSALGEALSERHEFLRTVGEHRPDGSYVVSRRGAESSGHRKVFDSFAALERLYERLPREFTARDVGGDGLTGSRRHALVHHLAEHPAFDCELSSRQPLTGRKTG
jgi:hypothetical protein